MSAALAASGYSIRTARADVWLVRVAWTVIALSCVQVLLFGFGRDHGIYAVVGDSILAGKMPYRDAWDFKPPGIFLVFAFAQALFGKSMASVRLVEVTALLGIVLAFRRLGRALFGSATAGLVGGALAVLVHTELEFWHTAQPEFFGGVLTVLALVLVTGRGVEAESRARRATAWAAVGALFGAAFLFKPPLGGGAVACAVYLGAAEYRRSRRIGSALLPAIVAGLASFVPIGLCALWFRARGAWPALSWTMFEFTPGYTRLGWDDRTPAGLFFYGLKEGLTGFSYVIPPGLALAVLLPRSSPRERGGIALVTGIVLVQVVGIAMQAKFFQYHYSATLPLLSLVAGLGLHKAWRLATRVPVAGPLLYAAVLGVLVASRVSLRHNPGTFWERSLDRLRFLVLRSPSRDELDAKLYHVVDYDLALDRRVALEITRRTAPGDSIFIWGFDPHIYWFSGRSPASRYLYDVPQRAQWQRERARDELMRDLRESRPRVVVVGHGDTFDFVTGDDLDSFDALETFPELATFIEDGYPLAETMGHLDIHVRRSP